MIDISFFKNFEIKHADNAKVNLRFQLGSLNCSNSDTTNKSIQTFGPKSVKSSAYNKICGNLKTPYLKKGRFTKQIKLRTVPLIVS